MPFRHNVAGRVKFPTTKYNDLYELKKYTAREGSACPTFLCVVLALPVFFNHRDGKISIKDTRYASGNES